MRGRWRKAFPALAYLACLPLAEAGAQDACPAVDPPLTLGVNRTNLMWETDSADILAGIAGAGIGHVRLSFSQPYENVVRTIREAREHGLGVLLAIGMGQNSFRPQGLERRPGGFGLHSAHRLSTLDPTLFRRVVGGFLARLDAEGLVLDAIELGNEENWSDFNGDLPIGPKGEGRFYESRADLAADPDAANVLEGFRRYGEAVGIARDLVRESRLQQDATIVSSGLFTASREWTGRSGGAALSYSLATELLRENGVFAKVDAVGVHLYPGVPEQPSRRMASFMRQIGEVTGECRAGGGKTCWLTEWGFPKEGDACTLTDEDRLRLFRDFRRSVACLSDRVEIGAAYLYDWDDSRSFSIHRCGRNLPSAEFFAAD